MSNITERDDVSYVVIVPWNDNDGGLAYRIGYQDVTMMKIVKRHGVGDWMPYVEVWQGDRLFAEIPQHNTLTVEFIA
jgi:hypothetical protein